MVDIGKELKKCRKRVDMDQMEFAIYTGITQATISRMENNKFPPNIEFLAIYHKKADLNVNKLLRRVMNETK